MISSGLANWKYQYEISPIYLTGGIAGSVPGAGVPLISYLQSNSFSSLISPGVDMNLDEFFAHFMPVSGGLLEEYELGRYPFANQATAANAIITMPLHVSLLMICPAKNPGDYGLKMQTISALKATLDQHALAGGAYVVATPSYLYTDCILRRFADASAGASRQPQYQWQLDFEQPLISQQAASQAQGALMSKIGPSGAQVNADAAGNIPWSSPENTVNNPGAGASPVQVPANVGPGLGFDSADSGFSETPSTSLP